MNDHPLSRFITFVKHDQDICRIEREIVAIGLLIQQLTDEQVAIQKSIEKAASAMLSARKDVDLQEFEMNSLEERSKALRMKLETALSSKEAFSLNKELDLVGHGQEVQEVKVLNAWRILDKSKSDMESVKRRAATEQENVQGKLAEQQAMLERVNLELASLSLWRDREVNLIPEEWRTQYKRMREFMPNPVVPAVNGYCGACSYPITAQDIVRIGKLALIECKSCFRFIFSSERLATISKDGPVSGEKMSEVQ